MPTKQKTSPKQSRVHTMSHAHVSPRARSLYATLGILATLAILTIAVFQLVVFITFQDKTDSSSDTVLGFLQKTINNNASQPTASAANQVETKTIQAVFLTNGQVYFGRITTLKNDLIILEDVFYPKAQESEQAATDEAASADAITAASGVALRKLGKNEFHEPQDTLYIQPNNVLYWENLEQASRVTKGILEYEAKQKSTSSTVKTTPATEDASAKKEASEATVNTNSNVTSEEDPTDLED